MFCVLSVESREKNLFNFLFGRFVKDNYELATVPVLKGAPFYMLKARVGAKGLSGDKIIQCVGKCAAKLITTPNTVLPSEDGIGRFKSELLYNKMMDNTFIEIIKTNYRKNNPFSVCIIDKQASDTDFVCRAAQYASKLTVVTDNKSAYSGACEEIMSVTGLCPGLQSGGDGDIVINCDKKVMTVKTGNDYINIACGTDFTVPQAYRALLPCEVDRYDFYSALYELCGVFALGAAAFESVEANGKKMSVCDVHFT